MTASDTDVLVVGAGPVGTALAIDLRRRGVEVRVVDKAAHGFDGSRAKGIQPRTLEVFDDLGVLDAVLAGGARYPLMGIHLGPVTVPWRMLRSPHANDDGVPHPHTWLIPQSRTDRALHDRLDAHGVGVEYGTELSGLDESRGFVAASVTGPAGRETIVARYVVGADGGSSAVRKQVGIGFVGSTDEADRMLIVDAAVDGGLSRDRWHIWPGLGGRFVAACPLPHSDQFQWMIRLGRDETPPVDAADVTRCLRTATRNKRIAVKNMTWKSVFRPNIRLADSFRRGRVFIAGDAAHAHTPAGGQGLNTGIQDSYNLGWKLAQVLAGAPPELLDTYEAERQPIAAGVLGLSTKTYAGFGKLDPSSIKRGKDEQQIALSYRGGPLAPSDSERTATLAVGDRAPDARLDDRDRAVRLFDLYRGPHFTLIAYGPSAAAEAQRITWPSSGASLLRVTLDAADKPSCVDHSLRDGRGSFRHHYGIERDTTILVRPDGYIAAIATHVPSSVIAWVAATVAPPPT